MNKLSILALGLLLACHGKSDRNKDDRPVVQLPLPHKLPPAPAGSAAKAGEDHAASIDNEYATLLAMYNAPTGATPCESAYNAVTAEQEAAKSLKRDSVFTFVAPKADFLKQCGALGAMVQQCLVPKYQSQHGVDCDTAKPADADLAKLYVLRKDLEPPKEPGQLPAK
jgi:hypothetical protein